jgi:hypothetical protein
VDKKKRKAELDSIRHKRKKEAEREDPLYAWLLEPDLLYL